MQGSVEAVGAKASLVSIEVVHRLINHDREPRSRFKRRQKPLNIDM
jgi:hypothetical protein